MSEELCECRVWPGVHVAVSLTQVRAYISHLVTKCMYIPTVLCGCGAALRRSDTDHGMRCSALDAQVTLRHGILKGILRCAVHRAGTASALEPPLCRLPGLSAGSGTAPDGSATRAEAGADGHPWTIRSGVHMLGWSRMAVLFPPSPWSLRDALACRP
jgi:hypothetical protein